MVRRRAGDAAEHLARAEPAEPTAEPLAGDAPPVGAHRDPRRRVGEDRRGPLDGVDLRHQRGVDQPRLVEQLVVATRSGMLAAQPVADRVVLEHEQRVQERQADPEVARDPGEVGVLLEVGRRAARRCRCAACRPRRRAPRPRSASSDAVDLRAVPPVAVGGDEGVGGYAGSRSPGRVAAGAGDRHRPLGPVVVAGERISHGLALLVRSVAEPVVDLELDPGGREHVERRRRQEALAGHAARG